MSRSKYFFGRDNELQIYRGNWLLMDIKHQKLFVIKRSQGCKLMPKCTQMRLAAGLCQDPLGEIIRSPRPAATVGHYFKGEEGKGTERRGALGDLGFF